jgi:hypothetical protein
MPKTERGEPEERKRHHKKRKTRRSNLARGLTQLAHNSRHLDDDELEAAVQELLRRHNEK